MQSSFATRAALLAVAAGGRRFGTFPLPVCGLTVRYRSLSELEFSQFQMDGMKRDADGEMLSDEDRMRDSRLRLIALCLCDEAGARLLNDGDLAALAALDSADAVALNDELRAFVGLTRNKQQQVRQTEDVKKNSPATAGAASPTV